jgi:hypothetical protein
MMKATGWQPHSVRGFLAGVVRKRLGLILTSKTIAGTRVYQITRAAALANPDAGPPDPHAACQDRSCAAF